MWRLMLVASTGVFLFFNFLPYTIFPFDFALSENVLATPLVTERVVWDGGRERMSRLICGTSRSRQMTVT